MRKSTTVIGIAVGIAMTWIAGCGREVIKESDMEETVMTSQAMETEITTEDFRPEPSFAAQIKASEDLEQLIVVEAHSREGITATVTMHEKQDETEGLPEDGSAGEDSSETAAAAQG